VDHFPENITVSEMRKGHNFTRTKRKCGETSGKVKYQHNGVLLLTGTA